MITQADQRVALGKSELNYADVVALARGNATFVADLSSIQQVNHSWQTLLRTVEQGVPIYGVTRGVGENLDRQVLSTEGGIAWNDAITDSARVNRQLLNTHAAGVGEQVPDDILRAAMIIRTHGLLQGRTGCSPALVGHLIHSLNGDCSMSVRSGGSIGQADIALCGELGLAISPIEAKDSARDAFVGRDALSLISTNCITMAWLCFEMHQLKQLLHSGEPTYLASLNGLNGNLQPLFGAGVQFQAGGPSEARQTRYRDALDGSYLAQPDERRRLQDPLSFRCGPVLFETLDGVFERCEIAINTFLNANEDNPMVSMDGSEYVVPTANFCPMQVTAELGALLMLVGHLAVTSAQRTLRLSEPELTGLERFLAADEKSFGFCALQKIPVSLIAGLQADISSGVLDMSSMDGGMEDYSTHLPLLVKSLRRRRTAVEQLMVVELLHACQALALRRRTQPRISFGKQVDELFRKIQTTWGLYEDDRPLTIDLQMMGELIKGLG